MWNYVNALSVLHTLKNTLLLHNILVNSKHSGFYSIKLLNTSVTEKYIGVKRIWSIFEYNILKYVLIRLIQILQYIFISPSLQYYCNIFPRVPPIYCGQQQLVDGFPTVVHKFF